MLAVLAENKDLASSPPLPLLWSIAEVELSVGPPGAPQLPPPDAGREEHRLFKALQAA